MLKDREIRNGKHSSDLEIIYLHHFRERIHISPEKKAPDALEYAKRQNKNDLCFCTNLNEKCDLDIY